MHKFTRSLGLTLASVGCAASMALSTATPAGAAKTALMVNGFGAGDLNFLEMASLLGGMFGSYQRVNVSWPQQARPLTGSESLLLGESIAVGAGNLDAALDTALAQLKPGEHVTLVGLSAGALVVDQELRNLLSSPDAPDKSKLKVVVAADSSRMLFNQNKTYALLKYTYAPPPETIYDTTVVTAEYDGFADFPDRRKMIAVLNAAAGALLQHVPAMLTDLSTVPASNITVKTNSLGGVTTSYLIPAAELPLVRLFPSLKPREAELKKIVDSAYVRNDNTAPANAVSADAPDAPMAPAPPVAPAQPVQPAPLSVPAEISAPEAAKLPQRAASRAKDVTGSDRTGVSRKSATGAAKAAAADRSHQRRAG